MVPEKETTIIIIDDEADIVELAQIILESRGYQVYGYTDSLKVESELTKKPDLVLTDLYMPDMDGISVSKKIRGKFGGNIPVIVMSAIGIKAPDLQDFIVREGKNRFIAKPFSYEDIVGSVEHVLEESLSK